jgi:hypothetical protein
MGRRQITWPARREQGTRRGAFRRRFFGRRNAILAALILCVAFAHPPHGLGMTVCLSAASTGIACPGCGPTRSLSCAARGMLAESWRYHPFGAPVLAMLALIAAQGAMPERVRRRWTARVLRRHRLAGALYAAFVAAFVAHGIARAVAARGAASQPYASVSCTASTIVSPSGR